MVHALDATGNFAFRDFEQVRVWEQVAVALLKKYCERFYNYKKSAAEAPHLKYVELTTDDENFIEGEQYLVRLDEENASLQRQLNDLRDTIIRLRDAIKNGDFSGIALAGFGPELKPLFVREHLYHPLIYADGVEVTPVALNDGERQFVEDLRDYYQAEKSGVFAGKELYLLRNRSRGRGIGFFEAGNFYPDFIVWILSEGTQYITFVDPEGYHSRIQPGFSKTAAPQSHKGKGETAKQSANHFEFLYSVPDAVQPNQLDQSRRVKTRCSGPECPFSGRWWKRLSAAAIFKSPGERTANINFTHFVSRILRRQPVAFAFI